VWQYNSQQQQQITAEGELAEPQAAAAATIIGVGSVIGFCSSNTVAGIVLLQSLSASDQHNEQR
jgi:hypothetical protein